MAPQTIPVLDLQDFISGNEQTANQFVQSLGDALHKVGFFALINHGVEPKIIRAAYGAAEAFFALSNNTKAQYEIANLKGQKRLYSIWQRTCQKL